MTPQVKAHLSVLLGLIVLVKAWGYYLGRFDLLVSARGVVTGLGSHVQWTSKLDGRLAQAIMCIHAVKAVEIGVGCEVSRRRGSQVHDEIGYNAAERRFTRPTNRAGGIEGGITNGEEIRVRGHLKPISTLRRPLHLPERLLPPAGR